MNKINLPESCEELTCEQAATIQGGAKIIVFTGANFKGDAFILTADRAGKQFQFTGKFDNSISSAKVLSGTWDLRSNPDGSGAGITLRPGNYSKFSAFGGVSIDNAVSLAIAAIA